MQYHIFPVTGWQEACERLVGMDWEAGERLVRMNAETGEKGSGGGGGAA